MAGLDQNVRSLNVTKIKFLPISLTQSAAYPLHDIVNDSKYFSSVNIFYNQPVIILFNFLGINIFCVLSTILQTNWDCGTDNERQDYWGFHQTLHIIHSTDTFHLSICSSCFTSCCIISGGIVGSFPSNITASKLCK